MALLPPSPVVPWSVHTAVLTAPLGTSPALAIGFEGLRAATGTAAAVAAADLGDGSRGHSGG